MACGYYTGPHSPGPLIDYYLYLKAYSCQQTVHFPACVSLAMLSSLPRMFSHLKTSSISPFLAFPDYAHPTKLTAPLRQLPWAFYILCCSTYSSFLIYLKFHDCELLKAETCLIHLRMMPAELVLPSSIYWIM